MTIDELLEAIAPLDAAGRPAPASARLKSKVYSRLVKRQSAAGQLLPLAQSKDAGAALCVFEKAVAALPGDRLQTTNPCRMCHARVAGERLEWAPIFWPGCPYSDFHNH
jgi:hypothetical protein